MDIPRPLRAIRRDPGSALGASGVLAIGISASVSVFALADSLYLRGVPFRDGFRITSVVVTDGRSGRALGVAPQEFAEWNKRQSVFDSLAAAAGASGFSLGSDPNSERLRAVRVTASLFDVLKVSPALGRPIQPEDELDGVNRVAVISDGLWRRAFGADSSVLGRSVQGDGGLWQIVGVMPAGFRYPLSAPIATDLWIPYVPKEGEKTRSGMRTAYLTVTGRLRSGVSIDNARQELGQITTAVAAERSAWPRDLDVSVRLMRDVVVGGATRRWVMLLVGASGLLLLISCANAGQLLQVRFAQRRQDIDLLRALGATTWQIARPLLLEAATLTGLATGVGIALATWGIGTRGNPAT
jgi:hypothetical protein